MVCSTMLNTATMGVEQIEALPSIVAWYCVHSVRSVLGLRLFEAAAAERVALLQLASNLHATDWVHRTN